MLVGVSHGAEAFLTVQLQACWLWAEKWFYGGTFCCIAGGNVLEP